MIQMNKTVNTYIMNSFQAYKDCADKFHEYYHKYIVKIFSIYVPRFDKHSLNSSNLDAFDKIIDEAIVYKLSLTNVKPNIYDFLYTLYKPQDYEKPLQTFVDDMLSSEINIDLIREYKASLEKYIKDPNIVSFLSSRL